MRIRLGLMSVMAGLVAVACGPTPPQAPLPEAKELDRSTSGISAACGESYQVREFPGDHRDDLATLEATAGSEAIQLAGVYRLNPAWIYQGETVTEIVKDGVSSLRACGLNGAAAELARATRVHPSG